MGAPLYAGPRRLRRAFSEESFIGAAVMKWQEGPGGGGGPGEGCVKNDLHFVPAQLDNDRVDPHNMANDDRSLGNMLYTRLPIYIHTGIEDIHRESRLFFALTTLNLSKKIQVTRK